MSDSASGNVELVNMLIPIIIKKILKKEFAQKIPIKRIKPKKEDIFIHFIYSPERSAIHPKKFGAKILLI